MVILGILLIESKRSFFEILVFGSALSKSFCVSGTAFPVPRHHFLMPSAMLRKMKSQTATRHRDIKRFLLLCFLAHCTSLAQPLADFAQAGSLWLVWSPCFGSPRDVVKRSFIEALQQSLFQRSCREISYSEFAQRSPAVSITVILPNTPKIGNFYKDLAKSSPTRLLTKTLRRKLLQ